MLICPHCDHPIRFFEATVRGSGTIWHWACHLEVAAERSAALDATRLEDWELEARRHESAADDAKAASDYHISEGR